MSAGTSAALGGTAGFVGGYALGGGHLSDATIQH
ncbi:uncharacterized protein PITG_09141 [Phytophthora infestans T30-4]|uniref:Uncharacterized protein n=1 Tax=Phytophthora infestans (strain T30-4) TaxID=403677 RepID=D0NBT2_PHYIT|nr:uncharacterized protein PITG_09141 [Phytophthora infestans T30-4]EEY55237.1 hypothetical protein PITG_09141 [Phytophthora infestans T30-4]|eukprot:XP_002903461.1 hypothetical protein PITG_09141 [Phytophthora infestans T30-4]